MPPVRHSGQRRGLVAHNGHKSGAGELGVLTVPAVLRGEQNGPIDDIDLELV
jgi:hypothetical protein